jgi:uncharacterized secreted repeat protein (TIGR03808 family)
MDITRRKLIASTGAAAGLALPAAAQSAPASTSPLGIDSRELGVRPGGPGDQSAALQRAIDDAARLRTPLLLAPGTYRAGNLRLPNGAQIIGARGATRIVFSGGASLFAADGSDDVTLSGLVLDGGQAPLPDRRGLLHLETGRGLRVLDCTIANAGGHGIVLVAMAGEVTGTAITASAQAALSLLDARGLVIARNVISGAGNNGILIWRSARGHDGTLVTDNRIERIEARAGGSGQNGNAVNVFRAGGVTVRGNQIQGCAFTAVRGNSAFDIKITDNTVVDMGEVAIYSEFAFEGAVIANNSIDGAAIGISVTNFNEGGRLAVVQGNIVRNLTRPRPLGTDPNDGFGIGIAVEADTAVTGNVVENATTAAYFVGFGKYLRDVSMTGNVARRAPIGVAVSVAPGAGSALIANNVISGATVGAIVGMNGARAVTGDLARDGAQRFGHLSIVGNSAS